MKNFYIENIRKINENINFNKKKNIYYQNHWKVFNP